MSALALGRIVRYQLSEDDAQEINSRRHDFLAYQREAKPPLSPGGHGRTGHIGHWGSAVKPGDEFAAMIVKVWANHPDGLVNLQVYLDGNDVYWATSSAEGYAQGQWRWPDRIGTPASAGRPEETLTHGNVSVKVAAGPASDLTPEQMRQLVSKVQEALLKQARRNNRTTMNLPKKETDESG